MKSIYFDTTIPNFLFDTREEMKFLIEITKKWWYEEHNSFHIYVSDETIRELSEGNYPNKESVLDFALKIDILPYTEEIVNIAESYNRTAVITSCQRKSWVMRFIWQMPIRNRI